MKINFLSDINKGYEEALNYKYIDQFIINLLWCHLGVFGVIAFLNSFVKIANYYPSPVSWSVISPMGGIISTIIALIVTFVAIFSHGRTSNHYIWRAIVTVALTIYSYLFVYISGGSIEMHFHFFMIAAVITVFADWRLGWILLVMAGLHHGILNFVEPGWVYFYGRNDFAVVAHAVPVLITVIFTTILCVNNRKVVVDLQKMKKEREAELDQIDKLLTEKETLAAKQVQKT